MRDFDKEPNYWEVLLAAVIFIGIAIGIAAGLYKMAT